MYQVNKLYLTTLCFIILSLLGKAQKDAKNIYEGNKQYHSGKISQSSASFAKAVELNPANRKANFNLGAALYKNALLIKSGQLSVPTNLNMTPDSLSNLIIDQAAQNFAVVANSVSNKDTLHQAWHNIGNCYLQKKDYKQAIEAYKKALRFDPGDEDSRYNLAYSLKHMPKEKKGGGGSSQQKNKKEEDKNDQNKNASPKKEDMDKQQAEQILKALMNAEKKLQDKRKQKKEIENSSTEKDW